MILGRLMRGMVEQNWTTVLLEVIVVIVGIFLGLQATEWHEDRQARAEGHYYLDLLRRQLDAEIQMREKDLDEMAERIDLLRNAYEHLSRSQIPCILENASCGLGNRGRRR